MRKHKSMKLTVDSQSLSSGKSVLDLILDKPGTQIPCPHGIQHVKRIRGNLMQICANRRCQRMLFVRRVKDDTTGKN